MPDIGTIIIALFGYGFTLLCAAGSIACMSSSIMAHRRGDRRKAEEDRGTFLGGVFITIALAFLTRWLVGGAI